MDTITGFSPVVGRAARVLILGSMPGRLSLDVCEYYAHPRNTFWRIMGDILDFDSSAAYSVRLSVLTRHGVALWDVLHSCIRSGSVDGGIKAGTRVVNGFEVFFRRHPTIEIVCFNGVEAEKSYNKYVLPGLSAHKTRYVRLPSTSAANAAISYEAKLKEWQAAIRGQSGLPG